MKTENVKEILSNLIRINSENMNSNKEIANYIKNKLSCHKIKEYFFKKDKLELCNLIIKIEGKKSNSPIVFAGHTDTVPICEGWKRNPLIPEEENNKIYGLGASDMKAGLACIISATLSLKDKPENDIYLLFDADEEGSMTGGKEIVRNFSIFNAKVIVAEPTGYIIKYGQKGCLDLRIIVKGRAMHSSKTSLANNMENNAIYKATTICKSLENYEKEIEKNKDKVYGSPVMNIGKIIGGTSPNVVANKCVIEVSRRLIPTEKINDVFENIKKIVKNEYPDTEIEILFWGEPFETNKKSDFIENILKISKKQLGEVKLDVHQAWTEAALFSKYGETIIFGPGNSTSIHCPDEYVEISYLEKFTEIYREIMTSL